MGTNKLRVITDFDKLSVEIQEQIKLAYPEGFSQNLIEFKNKNNETVSALPFETEEKYYMVRMSVRKAIQIIREDDDYDDDGFLKETLKDKYEDKYDDDKFADDDEEEEYDQPDDDFDED